MSNNSWQKRRIKFNHDWLKRYIPALSSWLNLLDEKIEDPELEESFISLILPQWEQHSKEAMSLPKDFEQEMSPRTMFDHPPLSKCDTETKQWMSDLVHALWLKRYPVEEWVSDAMTRAMETNKAYQKLYKCFQGYTHITSLEIYRSFRDQFFEFQTSCQALSLAINKFPNEVKVT